MKIFYISDENGKYISHDGSRRFSMLKGSELYTYLRTPEGKKKRFLTEKDDNGDEIGIEIADPETAALYEKEREHAKYMKKQKKKKAAVILSLDYMTFDKDAELSLEGVIPDPDSDMVACMTHRTDMDILYEALQSLNPEEMRLIQKLYLCDNVQSERAFARENHIPQKTLNDRKRAILEKLKKYF